MEAKELRKGSIVDVINRNHEVHLPIGVAMVIYEIKFDSVSVLPIESDPTKSSFLNVPIRDSDPIPLTEQVLIDCGFEKHASNPFWFRLYTICVSTVGSLELISWNNQVFKVNINVKHLHQLQNLYFALTGQELEYKPKN